MEMPPIPAHLRDTTPAMPAIPELSTEPTEAGVTQEAPAVSLTFPAQPATGIVRDTDSASTRFWLVALVLVLGFGFLSSSRREALSKFAAQIADVVNDFRGYDPEF